MFVLKLSGIQNIFQSNIPLTPPIFFIKLYIYKIITDAGIRKET